MKITRKFTRKGQDPFASVTWTKRSSKISNQDGSVVFEMPDAEVPESWSQLATDIMVSKYFRKAGVPQDGGPNGIASHDYVPVEGKAAPTGPEKSARQVIQRLAGCWRHWGETHGYFDSKADAVAFEDELKYMLVNQMCAPNSPQWFNTGLHWAYGINGPAQGHHYADAKTGQVKLSQDAYSHPQPHACFIQSVCDDLVNDGGIMDLWVREARLFKYGSGTGTNFSKLRAANEQLSGGGKSSGLMSWLKIGDRAAGAIKSGGTTRRAAKMVCLDLDHPDIEDFVNWKVREEVKVAALVEGMKHLAPEQRETAAKLGLTLDYDFNGESYATVSGQNANNSVRIPDAFFEALDEGSAWTLYERTTGNVAKELDSADLWDQIAFAAWRSADPGVQYDSTINAWHTCPKDGRINASNPCSEYMFLDNTACNLASFNLLKFYDSKTRSFDVEAYEHAIDLWTIVLEISVLMAQFPSKEIAQLSYEFRTLGLGYANIGAMLMQTGVAYDSDEARALCGCLTSILTGRSYRMSAQMARELGPFNGYQRNRSDMLRVIRNHRRAAMGISRDAGEWESLKVRPVPIDHEVAKGVDAIANATELLERATVAWDDALALGERHGFRNAQVTVIAPTGTIGLLMDCDTTGVEPDFALVKFKKLAGGGYFKIVNQSVQPALRAMGYTEDQIGEVVEYVLGSLRLNVAMPNADGEDSGEALTFEDWLRRVGFTPGDLEKVTASLAGVFEMKYAFNAWVLGDDALERVGIDPAKAKSDMKFDLLRELGLTKAQRDRLNEVVCGTQTVEGAPYLKDEHLAVFDCANTCGPKGERYIAAGGHIRMMAAAQPFISGAISKTINLPSDATLEEIKDAYRLSWELGLKANALYRDGCKLSQPLSSKAEETDEDEKSSSEVEAKAIETEVELLVDEDAEGIEEAWDEIADDVRVLAEADSAGEAVRVVERIVHRPMRRRLPDTRRSLTHKFNIAGHEGYLTVGLYEDGEPGELFITMAKEGSTIGGLMDSLGTATSVALQYGVPVESLVKKFTHQRFEPAGMTTNREIPMAKSLVDYIFRWMGLQFVPGYREQMRGDAPLPAAPKPEARKPEPKKAETAPAPSGGRIARVISSSVREQSVREVRTEGTSVRMESSTSTLSASMSEYQQDAPACDVCGTITVRSGTCYKCLNCGASMGCS